MEQIGVVGPIQVGGKAREVLWSEEEAGFLWRSMQHNRSRRNHNKHISNNSSNKSEKTKNL